MQEKTIMPENIAGDDGEGDFPIKKLFSFSQAYIVNILSNPSNFDDVFQETITAIWKSNILNRGLSDKELKNYVITAAKRSAFKMEMKSKTAQSKTSPLEEGNNTLSEDKNFLAFIQEYKNPVLMRQIFKKLKKRTIIILYKVGKGIPQKQIAKEEGLTYDNLRVIVCRARKRILKYVEENNLHIIR